MSDAAGWQSEVDALGERIRTLDAVVDRLAQERARSADLRDGRAVQACTERIGRLLERRFVLTEALADAKSKRDEAVIDPRSTLL